VSTTLVLAPPRFHRLPGWPVGWRRFARDRAAVVGLLLVLLVVVLAVLGPGLAPFDANQQDLLHRRQAPSLQHPLGLDGFGRDILSRVLVGSRLTLGASLLAVIVGVALGVSVGMLGGFYGGWLDLGLMRLVDALLAFPYLLLAIVIVGALGPGLNNTILAVGISALPTYARVTRSLVLSLRENDYVLAARALGSTDRRVLWLHLLPNVSAPLIVLATVGMAQAILSASALSFLGLGAQPPLPEWGAMLAEGRTFLFDAPHVATFPGLAIVLAMLGFNLLGDGLRDTLDPRLKGMLGP
jgi:ABC-type dipeptide/oligopeptide/nickel transport system permease subunit